MTAEDAFAAAHAAIDAHDLDGLRAQLDRSPELVTAEGENGNDLLGMATATCDARLVELLLERGADPAHGNVHGWTALHQAGYVGRPDLARLLLDAGAPHDRSARGEGGTPLIVALFWGHRETAELLAARGLAPRNLRAAAGLDRAELVDELAGTPAAGAHRAFHRPHSGFPEWTPTDDPQEVMDEALSWAARNDAVAAITALLALGARIDADVYRGTALTWAAARGRVAALRALLDAGADPNHRGTFGGPSHGQGTTALHHAAEAGRLEAIRVLLAAGADPTLRDELYDSTPAGWAAQFGRHDAADLLGHYALRLRAVDDETIELIDRALAEDVGDGDVTALTTVDPDARARAVITQKAPGVISGLEAAEGVFARLDPAVRAVRRGPEGEWRERGAEVLALEGPARALLTGERTALNFLGRLSGIATATARVVRAVAEAGGRARILDTRKTTPGLRRLEKRAVADGGGVNHRAGLYDFILIKENHAALAGGVAEAVRRAREARPDLPLAIEVRDEAEIDAALEAGAPRLLLDNMTPEQVRAAVARVGGRAELEASGGVDEQTVLVYATIEGLDYVSMGALTHSSPSLDLSLLLEPLP